MRKGFMTESLPVLTSPMDIVPKCGECGLFKTCKTPKMPPSGKGLKKILVVAEAPGAEEDREGIQLIGNTGQKVMREFRKNGIDMRRDCILTNALICRPPNNEIKKNEMIDYCRPNLMAVIKKHNPEKIILLGTRAVESLLKPLWGDRDVGGIMRWAGYHIPSQELNAWVCPVFHPSHLLHAQDDPVLELMFSQHLKAACELKGRPWVKVPDYQSEVEVMTSSRQAAVRIRGFNVDNTVIAFDYETTCLKPDGPNAEIFTCSISNGKETIAFPWYSDRVKNEMVDILSNGLVWKVGSNQKFEDRWTRTHLKVAIQGWGRCTMLTAHALENASKIRLISSIKFQAFVHLGQKRWDSTVEKYLKTPKGSGGNAPNKIKHAPLRELLIYNGLDSLLEWHVAKYQHLKTKKKESHE